MLRRTLHEFTLVGLVQLDCYKANGISRIPVDIFHVNVKNISDKTGTDTMQDTMRTIAVLTEDGDLNIHLFDAKFVETTMETEAFEDETDAFEYILSEMYSLCSIQWQEIHQIQFK